MSIDLPQPPADQLDWTPALSWLPVLTAEGFVPGEFVGGEEIRPGLHSFPNVVLAPEVEAFLACLYDTGIVADMDWPTWLEEVGRPLYDDPNQLVTATLEQCRMLLIAHVRADRFVDGHVLSILRDGHLVAVLERVRALVELQR